MQPIDIELEEARTGPLRDASIATLRLVLAAWAGCVMICAVLAALAAMTAASLFGVNFCFESTPKLARQSAAILLKLWTCVMLTALAARAL